MDKREPNRKMGPGELAALKRQRFMRWFIFGTGAFGAVLGGVIGGFVGKAGLPFLFDVKLLSLPPALSMLLAIGFVIGFIVLPIYAFRAVDEMKAQRNLRGMSSACLAVLGGYPAWQMLAAGGYLPQPTGLGVFAPCYFALLVVLVVLKYRDGAFSLRPGHGD
ncbi:MAG: hypothetical protein ACKVOB_04530 [Sphingomonas sp.]